MSAERAAGETRPPGAVRIAVRVLIRPSLSLPLPHRLRRGWFELLARTTRVPEDVELGDETLGGVATERIEPPGDSAGAVLYLHGGGFVLGSPRTHRSITIPLALACGAPVYVPDYRLAPEHPYPAALDDVVMAYRALREGEPDEPVVLAGDSAGAGLAVALAVRARDERLTPPAALCLFCPLLDLESNGSHAGHDSDPGLPRSFVERGARDYLAGRDPRDPLASPVFADPGGLPPILVHAAGGDILRPDAETLARRAEESGTELELHVFDGLWHDFHAQAGALPAADAAIADAGAFLRRAIRPRAAADSARAARRGASPS